MRFPGPDGKVGHAEIKIGTSIVMLADEAPDKGYRSPQSLGGSGTGIMLYVEDVDGVFDRAIAAGGKAQQAVTDQFYGESIRLADGSIRAHVDGRHHVEDVAPKEMQRRMEAMASRRRPSCPSRYLVIWSSGYLSLIRVNDQSMTR